MYKWYIALISLVVVIGVLVVIFNYDILIKATEKPQIEHMYGFNFKGYYNYQEPEISKNHMLNIEVVDYHYDEYPYVNKFAAIIYLKQR
jgi:hypothetical protein